MCRESRPSVAIILTVPTLFFFYNISLGAWDYIKVGMKIILGIIGYFLFSWIGISILYSFIQEDTLITTIAKWECAIPSVITAIIGYICHPDENGVGSYLILTIAAIAGYLLPYSIGYVVLYNLINIGVIIYKATR